MEALAKLREAHQGDYRVWINWKRAKTAQQELIVFDHVNFDEFGEFVGFDFSFVAFNQCSFRNMAFENCQFTETRFRSDLTASLFTRCEFDGATFDEVTIRNVNFNESGFIGATFHQCTLNQLVLFGTSFIGTTFAGGEISDCSVFGVNVWGLTFSPTHETVQRNLRIESFAHECVKGESGVVSVDDIELAQLIHLLLNRSKFGNLINAASAKVVLLLGRFTPERKAVLEALADEARQQGLVPVIFDFEKPTAKTFTETIMVLAGISLFVVADVTSPKSSPLELEATVPNYQCPFIIIQQQDEEPFSMLRDLAGLHDWVHPSPLIYSDEHAIRRAFKCHIYDNALQIRSRIQKRKDAPMQPTLIG